MPTLQQRRTVQTSEYLTPNLGSGSRLRLMLETPCKTHNAPKLMSETKLETHPKPIFGKGPMFLPHADKIQQHFHPTRPNAIITIIMVAPFWESLLLCVEQCIRHIRQPVFYKLPIISCGYKLTPKTESKTLKW